MKKFIFGIVTGVVLVAIYQIFGKPAEPSEDEFEWMDYLEPNQELIDSATERLRKRSASLAEKKEIVDG